MEAYSQELYRCIIRQIASKISGRKPSEVVPCSASLHKLIHEIKDRSVVVLNFNKEGRLHSKYLDDRYEPAIMLHYYGYLVFYYLFDGEIKDCIHPFNIEMRSTEKYISYYSSERIKQELPIEICIQEYFVAEIYNDYNSETLIKGYKSGKVKISIADYPKQNYTLHNCMELALPFKFAD